MERDDVTTKNTINTMALLAFGYYVLSSRSVSGPDDDMPLDGKWAQGNSDPSASEEYIDKLGHNWRVSRDSALGLWSAVPGSVATAAQYGSTLGPGFNTKTKVAGDSKHQAAVGIDSAVYRWRLVDGDLKPKSKFPWLLVVVGVVAYKHRRR
jgi:hypothetical protein